MKPLALHIVDTTLRDGEQAPGVVFSLQEKLKIAEMLDKTGVPEIEIGMPGMSEREASDIRMLCNAGFRFKSLGWCRAKKKDIDAACNAHCQRVHISLPVSDQHIHLLGKSRSWVLNSIESLTQYARDRFEFVSIGAQDASRADSSFLNDFISAAKFNEVSRIRIADTVGIMNPYTVARLFRKLSSDYPEMIFEFHGHNDLGMATANALTAVTSGAKAVSVTVNGLGERAGNTPLEELVMALQLSMNYDCGLNTAYFSELSAFVEKASGRNNSVAKPITGEMAMCHESGIHTSSIIKNPDSYQILKPDMIGTQQPALVFGKHSGSHALISFLHQKGVQITKDDGMRMLQQVKHISIEKKRSLNESEILNIYQSII